MGNFSEKSMVSIGLVLALLGGTMWLTKIFITGEANATAILEIKEKQESYTDTIWEIKEELVKIRTLLEKK